MGSFSFPKSERLYKKKAIQELFDKGSSFYLYPFKVFFLPNRDRQYPYHQILISVSKKNFKKAVDRNRIKRLTREAWRLQKNELSEKIKITQKRLNVFFIYTGKELPDFATVKGKVAVALKKLADKIDENIPANS